MAQRSADDLLVGYRYTHDKITRYDLIIYNNTPALTTKYTGYEVSREYKPRCQIMNNVQSILNHTLCT